MPADSAPQLLRRCYDAAIAAVQPESALREPLARDATPDSSCWVIAVGKAARGMAAAISRESAARGGRILGGLIVGVDAGAPDSGLPTIVGDHPIPRMESQRAADALAQLVQRIPSGASTHIAISGGASALIGGPLPGFSMADVTETFQLLLTSGLDIHQMNAIRKRITCWSAGRLALALEGRRLRTWVISDVPGDDLSSIASGPCSGDPWTSAEVQQLLVTSGLGDRLPPAVCAGMSRETPKPDDPRLAGVVARIVANNRIALAAAADEGRRAGVSVRLMDQPLRGEAASMGRQIAAEMQRRAGADSELLIWGGETTVAISGTGGLGGRSQELALAAARELALTGTAGALLAAGTDGRDGPTDAAGAVVDARTWHQVVAAGRDPDADLMHHNSYVALAAAGALLRSGPTGTNVMDLAIALT
ncbi:MAG: glycerate kinase type-2 family protein [Gemmatimonadales bacterium]